MRPDFAADPVLEWCDDLAARRVVFGVGGEDQQHVQWQRHRIALNLHIAFLHDVEQGHLDLACEIGQFVDRKDSPVGARQQSVVHGELAGEVESSTRGFNRIDIADQVRYSHIWSRQLFDVTVLWTEICNWRLIAFLGNDLLALPAKRLIGIVVNLASLHIRQVRVEQTSERAQHATLRLSAETKQDEIMPR